MYSHRVGLLEDRFMQGLIAGAVGWIPQMIFTQTLFYFKVTKLRYLDFAAILGFNNHPNGLLQSLIAEFIVLSFLSFLGAIFALLVKVIASPFLMVKGVIFGGVVWFLIYAVMTLFKLEKIYPVDFATGISNLIGALIWGGVMAWTLLLINCKFGVKN